MILLSSAITLFALQTLLTQITQYQLIIDNRRNRNMSIQNCIPSQMSLAPIQAICPIDSLKSKAWNKVFRAECMIPFHTYSIKVVYSIAFMGLTVYVRIDLFLVPMIFPAAFPICEDKIQPILQLGQEGQIPIAGYSFNFVYCARCNLGLSCKSHIPGFDNTEHWRIN